MTDYSTYRYFKGNPFFPYSNKENEGKNFWCRVEYYAYNNGDNKEYGKLSETMLRYLYGRHFEAFECAAYATTWAEAIERATEMYIKGVWSPSYLLHKEYKSIP